MKQFEPFPYILPKLNKYVGFPNENAFTLKIVVFCAFCSRVYILALLYILISVLYILISKPNRLAANHEAVHKTA